MTISSNISANRAILMAQSYINLSECETLY